MKHLKTILIFLIIVASVILYWLNTVQRNKHDSQFKQDKELALKLRIQELYRTKIDQLNNDNTFNYNDSVFSSIQERLSSGMQIIFFVPEKPCTDCVLQEYKQLKALPASVQTRILLLTNFDRQRDLKLWMNTYKLEYPVYNSSGFLKDFADLGKIAFFTLDSTLIPQHFFIPTLFIPELSHDYYSFILSLTATEQPSKQANGQAKIAWDKTQHDFGTLKKDVVSALFEIQNNGDVPLYLYDIKTSCGCTVVEWDKKEIKKGGKTNLKINYTADKVGYFVKKITVFSNAVGSPHMLTIKGEVSKND